MEMITIRSGRCAAPRSGRARRRKKRATARVALEERSFDKSEADTQSEACLPARAEIGDAELASRRERTEIARAVGIQCRRCFAIDRLSTWIVAQVSHRTRVLVGDEVDVAPILIEQVKQIEDVGVDLRTYRVNGQGKRVVEVELARPRLERLILADGSRLIRIDPRR